MHISELINRLIDLSNSIKTREQLIKEHMLDKDLVANIVKIHLREDTVPPQAFEIVDYVVVSLLSRTYLSLYEFRKEVDTDGFLIKDLILRLPYSSSSYGIKWFITTKDSLPTLRKYLNISFDGNI